MARAFAREQGVCVAQLDQHEANLLTDLCDQVATLLGDHLPVPAETDEADTGDEFESIVAELADPDGPAPAPSPDPALRRLLPRASGDDEAAQEFARLNEATLARRKVTQLATARDAFAAASGRVEVPLAQAPAVLAALTDIRLVLAERMGMRSEQDHEELIEQALAEELDDNTHFLVSVYDFLAWLQESLVGCLLEDQQ